MRIDIRVKGAVRAATLGQPERPWLQYMARAARVNTFVLRPYGWTLWSRGYGFNPLLRL